MKVTIKDVAKKAGVSITTVSRAFNGYQDIKDATRIHIFSVAEELNYSPNVAARTLSSKKQKKIALILNELNLNRKSPLVTDILSGFYDYTQKNEIEFVLLFITKEKQTKQNFEILCYEHNIDGALVHGLNLNDPYKDQIRNSSIPTVMIDLDIDEKHVGNVSIDHMKAAQEAVNYLITLGHENIVYVNGFETSQVSVQRKEGYKQALLENQLKFSNNNLIIADFLEEKAYSKVKKNIIENPKTTAFFCASDLMAIGVMRAIHDLGYNVPQDFSVIGFDNILLASYVQPTLTTVSQKMDMIGFAAADMIWNHLSKKEKLYNKVLEHELIVRNSTKKVRTL